ncbi:amino acid ABC transporter substrate-binding protein [Solirubrobacter sp. CPCC 204708]|uniref:ABC transporter substrate-binding protein n=1 Tax=Solirubrobacter deserti TaxID=2282478 RepID=A0ABT4RTD9_9ACTN|nr:ABC transporter substrate-binding protein [Solirubrobacter deserti]MBE2320746.1 amino acid ABC transporter substrate-binding protein [Solirubrobacter deserti]MDA0141848.1 ABC transporter substrate-binding protein [Solirubrobacter deserti]
MIGALVPLSPPGWAEHGRHLLTGLELAARELEVQLVVRDTAGDPARAAAAVDEFADLGLAAVAGEFHSVVARAAAARADARGLPFLCSSAVIDALTDHPTDHVARLAPAQSHGWRIYADFLLAAGHRRIAVIAEPSVYWAAGTRILREHLAARGGTVIELDLDALGESGATAVLLLVGDAEPLVTAIREDSRLSGILIGAPAGQPELAEWGAAIPFLRYRADRLTPLGDRVEAALGGAPSFVALEGYDAILVLAEQLRTGAPWSRVTVEGTRGTIRFTRPPGGHVWQWTWPPVQVATRAASSTA